MYSNIEVERFAKIVNDCQLSSIPDTSQNFTSNYFFFFFFARNSNSTCHVTLFVKNIVETCFFCLFYLSIKKAISLRMNEINRTYLSIRLDFVDTQGNTLEANIPTDKLIKLWWCLLRYRDTSKSGFLVETVSWSSFFFPNKCIIFYYFSNQQKPVLSQRWKTYSLQLKALYLI